VGALRTRGAAASMSLITSGILTQVRRSRASWKRLPLSRERTARRTGCRNYRGQEGRDLSPSAFPMVLAPDISSFGWQASLRSTRAIAEAWTSARNSAHCLRDAARACRRPQTAVDHL